MNRFFLIIGIISFFGLSFTYNPILCNDKKEKIVFYSDRDGNRQIYIINSDGTDEKRLTHNKYNDEFPACSPDGTKIAFSSDRDGNQQIYIMDIDGNNQVRLTDSKNNYWGPAWSPDGTKIIFSRRVSEEQDKLYYINIDGSNLKCLGVIGGVPAWSPDGETIAFSSEIATHDSMIDDVFTMNINRTNLTRLTSNGRYNSPSWSPDGKRIIYTLELNGMDKIYVMDSDGKNKMKLSKESKYIYWDPVWSPDGKRIAYSMNTGTREEFNICVMNEDGTGQIRLTGKNRKGNFHPSWVNKTYIK